MCWAQHVSVKAWRFQNNLFQLVRSCTVTSIFECCWSFLALRFNATHPPSWPEVSGVEMLLEYQTMNLRTDVELASARPSPQRHLQVARALKWHFQLGSIGPLPLDFRQILPQGWSRAADIIRVTGFRTVPAVQPNHLGTLGVSGRPCDHMRAPETTLTFDLKGSTSPCLLIAPLYFQFTWILDVFSFVFRLRNNFVLTSRGSFSATVTRRSSNYLIVQAMSFFDLWSGIGGWPDL